MECISQSLVCISKKMFKPDLYSLMYVGVIFKPAAVMYLERLRNVNRQNKSFLQVS